MITASTNKEKAQWTDQTRTKAKPNMKERERSGKKQKKKSNQKTNHLQKNIDM